MGLNFKKRVKLGKKTFANVTRKGVSVTKQGKWVTVNSRGHITFKIPGTGISYTSKLFKK